MPQGRGASDLRAGTLTWAAPLAIVLAASGNYGLTQDLPTPAPFVFEKGAQAPAATASEPPSLWSKVPPVTPTPRAGAFFVPPTGPGYYSLRDLLLDEFR